jgi:hypothetical protein
MSITLLYWRLIALMLVGVVGAVVPGLPGSSLIVVAWWVKSTISPLETVALAHHDYSLAPPE